MNTYEQPHYENSSSLAAAIDQDDPEVLARMIIAAALYEEDFDVVSAACARLSSHTDEIVRGNAILGFGHLARLFGRTTPDVPLLVKNALTDRSDYVRGQAHAAAGDLAHFLNIEVRSSQNA